MEYTERNRLPLLEQGELGRYWGSSGINKDLALIDQALDDQVNLSALTVVSPNVYRLVPQNGSSDTQRPSMVNIDIPITSPTTIIVPKSENVYRFVGASSLFGTLSATNRLIIEQEETGRAVLLGFSDTTGWGVAGKKRVWIVVSTFDGLEQYGSNRSFGVLELTSPAPIPSLASLDGYTVLLNGYTSVNINLPATPSTLPDGYEVTFIAPLGNSGAVILNKPAGTQTFTDPAVTASSFVNWPSITVRKSTSLANPGVAKYLIMRTSFIITTLP